MTNTSHERFVVRKAEVGYYVKDIKTGKVANGIYSCRYYADQYANQQNQLEKRQNSQSKIQSVKSVHE